MNLSPDEVEAMVLYQVAALQGFARAEGQEITHVKPHGALYNWAAKEEMLADAIARAVVRLSREIVLVGLAGSALIEAGLQAGLKVAREAFPDRTYEPDGSLRPRSLPGAVISDPQEAAANGLRLVREGIQFLKIGKQETCPVDTLCVHGDTPGAVEYAKRLRQLLDAEGIRVS
jgi:UPF0271 protein